MATDGGLKGETELESITGEGEGDIWGGDDTARERRRNKVGRGGGVGVKVLKGYETRGGGFHKGCRRRGRV